MSTVLRALSPSDRRLLDRDHAVSELIASLVAASALSPRRDAELRQVGADRVRRVLDRLELAVVSAVYLEREERAGDDHARACSWCRSPRRVVGFGACRGLRSILHGIERLHQGYRRAFRRLGAS